MVWIDPSSEEIVMATTQTQRRNLLPALLLAAAAALVAVPATNDHTTAVSAGDGSTIFERDSIDSGLFQPIVSRGGGEVVGD